MSNQLFSYLIGVSLLCNAAIFIYLVRRFYYKLYLFPKREKKQEFNVTYYMERDKIYEMTPLDKNDIIFLGDSHMFLFPIEILNNSKIKNRGIPGDVAEGVYRRLDDIVKYNPDKVFIMVGTNDINVGYELESIIDFYDKILKEFKEKSSQTKIYIHSVLPVTTTNQSKVNNNKVPELNQKLRKLADSYGAMFIDLYPKMSDNDGYLKSEYALFDGIHLNVKGYKMWVEEVKGEI